MKNQLSLFDRTYEKGSSEWSAFAVQGDKAPAGAFRVLMPIKQQPRYTNVVPIRRFNQPHYLFPKAAH